MKLSKIMELKLTPENIKGIINDHRAKELRFLTTLKGPAGSDIEVVLPYSAQVEAAAAVTAQAFREQAFPPTYITQTSRDKEEILG